MNKVLFPQNYYLCLEDTISTIVSYMKRNDLIFIPLLKRCAWFNKYFHIRSGLLYDQI